MFGLPGGNARGRGVRIRQGALEPARVEIAASTAVEAPPERKGGNRLKTVLIELAASIACGAIIYPILRASSDSRVPENAIGVSSYWGATLFPALLLGVPLIKRIVSVKSAERACGVASLALGLIVFFWIIGQLGYEPQYDGFDYIASICLFILNFCVIGAGIIDALLRLVSGASKKQD